MVRPKLLSVMLLAVAVAVAASRPTMAAQPAPGGDGVHELIARISAAQRAVHSLKARFRQEKRSAMLLEPAVSTGSFVYLAPDRIRWQYDTPDPMVVVFDGRVLTTWDPSLHHLDRVHVSARQKRLMEALAGTRPLEGLVSHFRIVLVKTPADQPWVLRLEPTERRLKKKIRRIELHVDRKLDLPVAVVSVEADGDSTSYSFSHIEVNPPVNPSLFVVEPKGKVSVETYDTSVSSGGSGH
ncbi:MAG TPA: outer membrane lipoprotein carrier protein LolA [Acidobacteria bacterium]|nr:outer membrane lipoprotein carrier protein LolA [Acidobacteriota bacterium]